VKTLKKACSQVGFFYIKGHGVSKKLIQRTFQEMKRFFDLPLEKKMEISCKDTPNRGYFNVGEGEKLGEKKIADLKEAVDIAREDDLLRADKMRLPNKWPSNLPGWKETMDEYFAAMTKLGFELTHGIAIALNIKEDWFDDKLRAPSTTLRLVHYPPQEQKDVDEDHLGAGPHTDYGVLTILAQDNPGLQVMNRAGEWIAVPPIPDAFVINLGDMMPRWTNGFFLSTPHRVINTTSKFHRTPDRYSIPFFFEPDFEAIVECLPEYCSPENPPKFPPKKFGQHLIELFNKTY